MPRIYFTIIGGQPGYSIIPSGGALSAQQIVNGIASNLYAYGYAPQNIQVHVSTFGNVTATFYTDEDCTYSGLGALREGIATILANARIITSPTVSSSPSEIQLCGNAHAVQQEPGIVRSMQSLFGQNYLGGSSGSAGSVAGSQALAFLTGFDPSTGQPTVTTVPSANNPPANNPPPKNEDKRNWFDKTFFDGAGALTGTAIGVLVVLGAIVVVKSQQQ